MIDIIIKDKTISTEGKIFINAEMACSHDGNVDIAKKIIDTAVEAGADSINFQMISMENYMVRYFGKGKAGKGIISGGKDDSDIYSYIDSLMFSEEQWKILFNYAREKKILICAQPNDNTSFDWAKSQDPDFYSISSAAFSEIELVSKIAMEGKPIFLRIGGALLGEIEKVISKIHLLGNKKIVILYGFQNYPTEIKSINLRYMAKLKELFGHHIGFADHTDGDSELAIQIPTIAIPLGATVLEKHITHDRDAKCEDYESALGPVEFKKFIDYVNIVKSALGYEYFKGLSEEEIDYRNKSKKRIVSMINLKAGDIITEDSLELKRADYGMLPEEVKYLYGRKVKRDISKEEVIELIDLM